MDEKTPAENPKEKKKIVGLLMLEAGTEFAFLIAVPLIAGILGGKWLDNKYHHHFFVIIGLLAGIGITGFTIYRRILDYKKMLK
jgi:F0F1-type ATP synthase assembly protein I